MPAAAARAPRRTRRCGLICPSLSLARSEYLEGPFAPVDDEACEELEVEGSLPPDFRGTFIRNGQ
jgi:carotenoid cleavage dioxygenase-like enzyme